MPFLINPHLTSIKTNCTVLLGVLDNTDFFFFGKLLTFSKNTKWGKIFAQVHWFKMPMLAYAKTCPNCLVFFCKLKVLLTLPTSFHGPLDYRNALQLTYWSYNWSRLNWVEQADSTTSAWWTSISSANVHTKVNVYLCYSFTYKTTDDPHSVSLDCYNEEEAEEHHRYRRDVGQ